MIRIPAVAALLLATSCVASLGPSPADDWAAPEERVDVDLSGTFKTLDGEDVTLTDLNGDVLFLNVWATWCGPCRAEMPSMAALYEELGSEGLTMVAVSDEDPVTVREFLSENPYPFKILLDPDAILGERFEIFAIPTTLIVDSRQKLILRHTGAATWDSDQMRSRFRSLLAE